ncbi:hypothetical protein N0V87_004780 [Didymella glomerata]|uniref:DUF7730 domain-containing protein n=1 Tax=Didymella glomerata TaxID=749621 RepID=A0A9W8WZM5_9PLEO|nr:hypothetical protein N0V87_004780 [Didymella glomerata]
MASRTSTPRTRSPSTSSDSSDMTMLDAPTHVPLTPTRPRQPSLTQSAPSTQAPTSDPAFSLLLSLPRELRDRVYTFALTSPCSFWWPPGQAPSKHHVGVSLLQTNKQVYAEAAPVLYTGNKFLFIHPSDCTVFRIVASRHAEDIHSVHFRIREKDLPLWTKYLGSRKEERCLKHDLPNLKSLCISLRCGSAATPRFFGQLGGPGFAAPQALGALPPAMAVHVQAVQNALGQQVAALQQQVQHLTHAVGVTGPPVIVPTGAPAGQHHALPPQNAAGGATAAVPHHHAFQTGHQPLPIPHAMPQVNHNILATFLRHERELGIESLCLSLRETLHDPDTHYAPPTPASVGGHRERRDRRIESARVQGKKEQDARDERRKRDVPDVKIVCIMRVPKQEVSRLVRLYPEELSVDRNGDARTRFRRLHGVDICVEISGFEGVQG